MMALERGTLDKFGTSHDNEQRSVIYLLDQLINYVPQLHADYDNLVEQAQRDLEAANQPLYGNDRVINLTEDI